MIIGDRLRQIRESKKMSQGDVEAKTGLLRCYLSRCENNHTVPSIDTLNKWAGALGVPMSALFYEGDNPPKMPAGLPRSEDKKLFGSTPRELRILNKLRQHLANLSPAEIDVVVVLAAKMAKRREKA